MWHRFAALVAVAGVMCTAHAARAAGPCSPAAPVPSAASGSSAVVEAAVARLPTSPELQTGALGDKLIGQLVEVACVEKARPWLPSTCASPGPNGIEELRRRVMGDVARLPTKSIERYAATTAEAQAIARAVLAVIDTLLTDGSIETLARNLAGNLCVSVSVAGVPVSEIETAARVLSRVLEEPPSELVEEQVKRLEAALKAESENAVDEALSPVRRDALKVLAEALAKSAAEKRGKSSKPSPREIIRRSFEVATAAVTLARGTEFTIPTKWVDPIIALVDGGIEGAIDAQLALITGPGAAGERITAGEAVRTGLKVASVQSKDDAMRIIRSKLLGPWSEPFLFDLNVVKPILARGTLQFGGDFAIGYAGKKLGIRAQGGYSSYNLDDGRTISLTNKAVGSMDFWLTLGHTKTRFDLRTNAELAFYGTTVFDRDNGSGKTFGYESSINYRGNLSVGIRHEPNSRLAVGFWMAGGIQYELYTPFKLQTGDDAGLDIGVSNSASLNFQARLRAQYQLFPEYVALRLQSDLQRHRMVRAALAFTVDDMGPHVTGEAVTAAQIEWRTRLFIDAEVARFLGFVPGATAGFDFINRDGDTSVSTFVPIFGIGVRRTTM